MYIVRARWSAVWVFVMATLVGAVLNRAAAADNAVLLAAVEKLTQPVLQDCDTFGLSLVGRGNDADAQPLVEMRLDRISTHEVTFQLISPWAHLTLHRDANRTALVLPQHGVAFVGEGPLSPAADSLTPQGFLGRLLGPNPAGLHESALGPICQAIASDSQSGRAMLAMLLTQLPSVTDTGAGDAPRWKVGDHWEVSVPLDQPATIAAGINGKSFEGVQRVELSYRDVAADAQVNLQGLRIVPVDREQLERTMFRALRRLASVHMPGPAIGADREFKRVPNGERRMVDGQSLVMLWGTPQQMGTAHGQLLGAGVRRMIDSTLHLVGFVETVRSGKWFPDELDDAWTRLSPHIPERHRQEMEAIAAACSDVSLREIQLANVFPEYFHCSGFAVFGSATADGALYHGRVLDYMTAVGLQQVAVTLVYKGESTHPFVNVGYAGFIGSVSGMNDQQISLGEMGGDGRGWWDGVPMATLVRRALEECATLDEAKALWRDNPRTCEYYYVFADGKIPDAVGVAATPQTLEFIESGDGHAQLGAGISDAVVLSAGDRLQTLRQRVESQHGRLDAASAIALMSRPVAMKSNLHNALFVPQRLELYVANAQGDIPAADTPYVRYDLRALFEEIGEDQTAEIRP